MNKFFPVRGDPFHRSGKRTESHKSCHISKKQMVGKHGGTCIFTFTVTHCIFYAGTQDRDLFLSKFLAVLFKTLAVETSHLDA